MVRGAGDAGNMALFALIDSKTKAEKRLKNFTCPEQSAEFHTFDLGTQVTSQFVVFKNFDFVEEAEDKAGDTHIVCHVGLEKPMLVVVAGHELG